MSFTLKLCKDNNFKAAAVVQHRQNIEQNQFYPSDWLHCLFGFHLPTTNIVSYRHSGGGSEGSFARSIVYYQESGKHTEQLIGADSSHHFQHCSLCQGPGTSSNVTIVGRDDVEISTSPSLIALSGQQKTHNRQRLCKSRFQMPTRHSNPHHRWPTIDVFQASTSAECSPKTLALVEPFPRRQDNDVFQRIPLPNQSESKVRVNNNFSFLHFLSFFFLFFGYSAQQRICSSTALSHFGQNAFRWRRKPVAISNFLLLLHFISLIAFGSAAGAALNTGTDASSLPPTNPLLKHRRESSLDFREQQNMCHVWTKHTPRDLCSRSRWSRLRLMREIGLFSKDCDTEADNVQLGEFFRLDWQSLRSESDLIEQSEHLIDGIKGRSCILAQANSDECLRCFGKVGEGLEQVNHAYQAFDRVLHRFDCGLALDSASATRPFSPNGTCSSCKRWYRKWLLVQLVQVWRHPACINWCYYAQLSCPHLATIRVVDFAGHPTFLCRDLDIPQQGDEQKRSLDGVKSCDCVHPCDLTRLSSRELEDLSNAANTQQIPVAYDFFAADEHCSQRQKRCNNERARTAALSDDLSDQRLFSISSSSHRGFVDENSDEFYNRLISDRQPDLTTTPAISSSQSLNANELPFQQRKRKRRRLHYETNTSCCLKKKDISILMIVLTLFVFSKIL